MPSVSASVLDRIRVGLLALVTTGLLGGCERRNEPSASSAPSAIASANAAPSALPRGPRELPLAGERVEIPAGVFFAGSVPGDQGRDPELEPRRSRVELGPFQIDRLPYPNDPQQPFLTAVPREEARRLCAEKRARLCTELEWERACKGPNSEAFATGETWDPRCEQPSARCASGFDVVALGGAHAEWTASDVGSAGDARKAAVRGAPARAAPSAQRCAARREVDPTSAEPTLGFRCCTGAPNAAAVPEPKLGAAFEKVRVTAAQLQTWFAREPSTRELAKDIVLFKEPQAAETVVARGPGDRKGFTFTVAPLLWRPAVGSELLLVSGRSGESLAFVAAFHVLGNDEYRLASSFIMRNEPGPVAFAYDAFLRPRLHFSTCWGCPGETGKILFRKPERPVIVQP